MIPQKFKSSIALKLNLPIVFLGLTLFISLFIAYVYQTKNINQYQLKQLAETITDNLIISAQTNFKSTNLKRITNVLAAKNNVSRIMMIEEENLHIITDNHNVNIGKTIQQGLREKEQAIYTSLNSDDQLISSIFLQHNFYYLHKTHLINADFNNLHAYYIFIILNETETFIGAPNTLSLITSIFTLGMLLIFVALYFMQKRLILAPLAQITQHLTSQSKDETVTIIPFKSDDEIGKLVKSYNELIENKNKHDKELSDTRRHIDGITNTAPVLLSYIGTDLKFKFVNQIHENWFGIPIDEFKEHSLEDIIGEQAFLKMIPEIEKALSGITTKFETSIPFQNTEDKLVNVNVVPYENSENIIVGFFVCIEDLSETKKNETTLAEYALKLELREASLEEEKLVAEQALKIKSEFLASMSHEIRTPMNGVLGMLNLLMDTKLSEDQEIKASLAKTSAESLLNLINDILDFSKVESGKLEMEMIDFNLIETLENTTEALSKLAEDKSISLIIDTTEVSEAMVKGDPGRLRQVLTNLLSNALKFTLEGEVILKASLHNESIGSFKLICEVSDSGIGIEPEKLDSIFDSFTQVDTSTTRQYGGTGLGLAIAKKLCLLMGGDIQASSRLGEGSTFTCSALFEQSSSTIDSSKQAKPIDLTNSDFLIIDPNQVSLSVFSKQLTKWGATVKTATDFNQAMRLLKEREPSTQHFVIVNLKIDNHSGLDFIKDFQSSADSSNIKFILMTSIAFKNETRNIEDLGICDFFFKPATQTKLIKSINKAKSFETILDSSMKEPEEDIILPTNKRILLVEDTPINQLVVQGILGSFNLSCDIAGNGVEALEMMNNVDKLSPYDVILMDCQMPEMDGYEATKAIREGQAGELSTAIPIIAMTANAMKGDEEKCLEAGMNDYISKPVDPMIVKQKLAKWLI